MPPSEKRGEGTLIKFDFNKDRHCIKASPLNAFVKKAAIKLVSGKWEIKEGQLLTCWNHLMSGGTESIALAGSGSWKSYTFSGWFNFISGSAHPDEGGVILYFRYKNSKNHYSFHFCFSKKRVEMWKKFKGEWSMINESAEYPFMIKHPYFFTVTCDDDAHTCYVGKEAVLKCMDSDIRSGYVGIAAKYCSAGFRDIALIVRTG